MKKVLILLFAGILALSFIQKPKKKRCKKKTCTEQTCTKHAKKDNTAVVETKPASNTTTVETTTSTMEVKEEVKEIVKPVANLVWYDDIEKAKAVALKEDKQVMLFFTGSDWCGWCKRLQAEVFVKDDFKTWAAANVILVELDFPKNKAQSDALKTQNRELQQQFGVAGYPTCHFAKVSKQDKQLNLVASGAVGYVAGGPTAWIAKANSIIGK